MAEPDPMTALAAETAAAFTGAAVHQRDASATLHARILVVEAGGRSTGGPDDDATSAWTDLLAEAGIEPGMCSWWNAIPSELGRPATPQDKATARTFLKRAIALHTDLHVVVAVGGVAQAVVKAAGTSLRVKTVRSPLRTSDDRREQIRAELEDARLYAYPAGFDPT